MQRLKEAIHVEHVIVRLYALLYALHNHAHVLVYAAQSDARNAEYNPKVRCGWERDTQRRHP